jgi:glycosyltransferase involved in cell wall biosynthesis
LVGALQDRLKRTDLTLLNSRKATSKVSDYFPQQTLWTPPHHRFERWALSVEIARFGLDVLHSPDFIPPRFGAKRRVITIHDLTFLHYPETLTEDSRRYYNDQIEAAVQEADHILVVSRATQTDLITTLNVAPEKISISPNGVGKQFKVIERVKVKQGLQALNLLERYFLHVGTWEPRKNLVGLARAYKLLCEKVKNAPPLLFVGRQGWHFERLKEEVDTVGVPIIWRDDIRDEHLPLVYNGAICNMTVSFYEGFGLPALEGMACGIIPIVSNRSSLPEVVGEVGLQVIPEDPEAIAAAMQQAFEDEAWRNNQRPLALAQAANYTWERCAAAALVAYQSP